MMYCFVDLLCSDFGIEARWWMNWRTPRANVAWINKYSGSITTVHPAHNMLVVEQNGGYRMDTWFNFQEDIVRCVEAVRSFCCRCFSLNYQPHPGVRYRP